MIDSAALSQTCIKLDQSLLNFNNSLYSVVEAPTNLFSVLKLQRFLSNIQLWQTAASSIGDI